MNKEKTLSIIIPTYNMEKYLRKCLDSLIVSDENMQRLEVLVVNDGSKDSSSKIAHEYETKYPQTFRVVDKENGNYGSCINRGLKEAKGMYVKVLDADDFFSADILDIYIGYLNQCDTDLVISDFNVVDEFGICLSEFTFNLPVDHSFKLQDIPSSMNTKLLHHSIAYKREVFCNFNYKQTEGISYTDDEWIFKPMMWVKDVDYFPHTLYFYLRGREGQTFDPKVIACTLEQRVTVAKEMTDFFEDSISSCRTENKLFVTEKLVLRLKTVYYYHLIKYANGENMKRIMGFDEYLLKKSPLIYEKLNQVSDKVGLHYIKQWRKCNYSKFTPALLFRKVTRYIDGKMKTKDVVVDRMPNELKRKLL